jgi:DNA integrity scanning protein DisA with diadenylate cyclase activity
MLEHALVIVNCDAAAGMVVVVSSAETAKAVRASVPGGIPTVWACTTKEALLALEQHNPIYLPFRLDRLQVLSFVVVHAIIKGSVDPSKPIVCLSEGPRGFDLLQTMRPDVDLDLANIAAWTADRGIDPNALLAVLEVAVELGSDRTGRAAGTLFTIGDARAVLAQAENYPFEPFEKSPAELRQITSPATQVAVQKYARVDGVFVIEGDGLIERFVKQVNPRERSPHLDQSMGSRHAAAAGITLGTRALAILVTESAGNVKLFRDGRIALVYKPR